MYHIPVLAEEATSLLLTRHDGLYVDATLGGGGHTELLLERLSPEGRVIGIDQDFEAIEHCRNRFAGVQRLTILHENFRSLARVFEDVGIDAIDGILMDLGISSYQIDTADRGFSFKSQGPLDMRMDKDREATAADFLNNAGRDEIEKVIRQYGEEKQARRIANAIVDARDEEPLLTTESLRGVIERTVSPAHIHKTHARVFQAVRIHINEELRALEQVLEDVYPFVQRGGRFVVISYHSLEDRIVKRFFKDKVTADPLNPYRSTTIEQRFHQLTKKPLTPDDQEISRNPRARSARLRAAEKV